MIEHVRVHRLDIKEDHRGWLAEVIRGDQMASEKFGQFHVSTAYPGVRKGGHYHAYKNEWFCVIKGKGRLELKDIVTGEKLDLLMGEGNLVTVYIPPHVAHEITNVGEEMMYLLVYIDHPYDPDNADTHPFEDFG